MRRSAAESDRGRPGAPHEAAPGLDRSASMTTTEPVTTTREIDPDKLMAFVFRAVDEVGATLNTALVVMGDRLGYYRLLADGAPTTPGRLAERSGTGEPYAREWLNAQAAGGYVTYDAASGTYTLPAEHA